MRIKIVSEFQEVIANKKSVSMRKLQYGVGINDANYQVNPITGGKRQMCPYYRTWTNMLRRCYDTNFHGKNSSYIGCNVCDSWLTFSKFKAWMMTQDWAGKQLDKDLLFQGNKVYSPDTCIFVTQAVNCLMTDHRAARGEYAIGVQLHKINGKYRARCNANGKEKSLGYHLTEEEASQVYLAFKKELIIITANRETDLKLKDALLKIANKLIGDDND